MSKQVLLLCAKQSVDKELTHPDDLRDLLNKAGENLEVHAALFEDLLYHFDGAEVDVFDTANKRSLASYDVVYFRYWGAAEGHAIAAARFCHLKGITFVDSETLRIGSQNKITQYMNLFEIGVAIPRTLIGSTKMLREYYQQYGFDFPLIVKSKGGTRGADNFKLHDTDEMQQTFAAYPDVTFVMQEFIPNEGDYRIVVMGDEVVMVIERTAAGDTHLNNTSQGGAARIVPVKTLPQAVLDDSVRAAKFYQRQIAGVDMVRSTKDGAYYCFEVNRAPQIEHASFESDKAAKLARYLDKL